jgi:hypothetical protein
MRFRIVDWVLTVCRTPTASYITTKAKKAAMAKIAEFTP